MEINLEFFRLLQVFTATFLVFMGRYIVFAGVVYLIFWVWKREKWQYKRTQIEYPDKSKILYEIKYSILTMGIFSFVALGVIIARQSGLTKIYMDYRTYSAGYFVFSIIAMLFIHDTFFYWVHRLMHQKAIFKYVHKVHHNSTNPSPWASFSFHPTEAVLEAIIVPLFVFMIPVHPFAILAFMLIMNLMNVLGHLGFEIYPNGFTTHWLGKWNNTATHHNMHHKYYNCNYGLYFNFWDRVLGTNHVNYFKVFDEVTSRKPNF